MKTTAIYQHSPRIGSILIAACAITGSAAALPPGETGRASDSSAISGRDIEQLPTYTLFNPMPANNLPQLENNFFTNTPLTVPAGWFTAQTSFSYGYRDISRSGVDRTNQNWSLGNTLLTAGLANKLDFELGIPLWQIRQETVKDSTGKDSLTRTSFLNDFSTALKYNAWSNDGGANAVSFLGTMNWPTTSCGDYSGGLSALFAYRTPCGCDLRFNTGFMLSQNRDNNWETTYDSRISLSHSLGNNLSGLVGLDAEKSTSRRSEWNWTLDMGLVYKATSNFQFCVLTDVGLAGRTNDVGISLITNTRF